MNDPPNRRVDTMADLTTKDATLDQMAAALVKMGWLRDGPATGSGGYDPSSTQYAIDSPKLAGHQWRESYLLEMGATEYVFERGELQNGKFITYGAQSSLSAILAVYSQTTAQLNAELAALYPAGKSDTTTGDDSSSTTSSKASAELDKAKEYVADHKAVVVGGLVLAGCVGGFMYLRKKKENEQGNNVTW